MNITRDQIKILRAEASAAGDWRQVDLCTQALAEGPSSEAWGECEHAIAMRMAQEDR